MQQTHSKTTINANNTVFQTSKTFSLKIDTYLKDSNAFGNIYFSKFFEWQGMIREKFFITCITDQMLNSGILLLTKEAYCKFEQSAYPFDTVIAHINTFQVRKYSSKIKIRFKDEKTGNTLATGYQTIAFMKDTKFFLIPEEIRQKLKEYEVN